MARRGQGSVFRATYTDRQGKKKRAKTWSIAYYVKDATGRPRKVTESSGSTVKADAVALLNKRLAERETAPPPSMERVTFETLVELLKNDYKANGNKEPPRVAHLSKAFKGMEAKDITGHRLSRYVADRLEEGAKPATINRELSAMRRAFNIAVELDVLSTMPKKFPMLKERNVRQGFWTEAQFAALLEHLPEDVQPLAQAGFITGWRLGELLSRCWRHVDLEGGTLRLEAGETKNGEARTFPLIPQLRTVIEEQARRKLAIEKRTGRIIEPLFFHYDGERAGKPIRDFRRSWEKACEAAGWPGALFHDLRRTAARNLGRAGVPQTAAMKFLGHRTDAMWRRYSIQDEVLMQEYGERYAAHLPGSIVKDSRRQAASDR